MAAAGSCSLLMSLVLISYLRACIGTHVSYDERALTIDGRRRLIISGSIHYPRSTPEMWPSLIKKAKEGGLNAIETYVFWNAHETLRRQYDFTGNLDVIRFIKTIQDEGLYAIVRIGPYVCGEWNFGGLPVWLHDMPWTTFRTNNDNFKREMEIFVKLIADKLKNAHLFASQGGPIILSQIENEYGNIMGAYGNDGKSYVDWCANLADSLDIGVPWMMCQQTDAPSPMIETCNGFYCDQYQPQRKVPKMWTENWTGWYKDWGDRDPHRTAEDVAFATARFFQTGGTMQNYYMYHGGTNFGRIAGGPYITTSYDYDAPLDEYGNLNQPKWGHLKQLHHVLKAHEKILTMGDKQDINLDPKNNLMGATIYSLNGSRLCFFGNANWDKSQDLHYDFEGTQYVIPAWSVSIVEDCRKVVYNTAQINGQTTSVMAKKLQDNNLVWKWKKELPENVPLFSFFGGDNKYIYANELRDQKIMTQDTTDYLWVMTRVQLPLFDPLRGSEVTLHVHTMGHVLHVFVEGEHIGTQWSQNGHWEFVFERTIRLNWIGDTSIALLSATVGLENYGSYYDKTENGILGPVKLMADGQELMDLSNNEWAYKVGLDGMDKNLQEGSNFLKNFQIWNPLFVPKYRRFTWYTTTFQTPPGEDPVALDLFGMGKGIAWVNGHNIGRYWPAYLAGEDGCSNTCDFRGAYGASKCTTNCGQPSQRWYHVPRSWLNDQDNTLVLFEEIGGDPMRINVRTLVVERVCGEATEGHELELHCEAGRKIKEIVFGSFGHPEGSCGSFEKGDCEAIRSLSIIKKACVGKKSCSIEASGRKFRSSRCNHSTRKLAVEAICA